MSQFITNSQVYNVTTENEVATILSRFNSQFILDVIRDNLGLKFNFNFMNNPNIVSAFEQNFKQLQINYPSDKENVESVRVETYKEIINILCKEYRLQFNDTNELDYYSLAFYLYDFLLANFNKYMTCFFAMYVVKEKNNLYEQLNMELLKKNKDSSTLYNKKVYKDIKLAVLNANLDFVLSNVCQFDIPFENILFTIYSGNKSIINFILNFIAPIDDFFKIAYCQLLNTEHRPIILTNIRLEIQKITIPETVI